MKDLKELTREELVETSGGYWLCIVAGAIGVAYIVGKIKDWW